MGKAEMAVKSEGSLKLVRSIAEVIKPYFSKENPHRIKAMFYCALIVAFMIAETWILVKISYNQRVFSTAMSEKNIEAFYEGVYNYVFILALAAPIFAVSEYIRGRLTLDWRQWLTNHICRQYFLDRAYFHLKNGTSSTKEKGKSNVIDNPDQRIANDVESFTSTCVTIIVIFGGKIFRVFSFLGVLYSISPELVGFCLLYSVFGTGVTTVFFGGKLKGLHYSGIKSEADFRFSLVRTREYAEEIAFYHGGSKEMSHTLNVFDHLIAIGKLQLKWSSYLKGFQNGFSWATYVLPYLIVAHKYFEGEMEFGVISQSSFAFQVVQGGLSFIVQNIKTLSSLAAETDRLHDLMGVLEGFHSSKNLYHDSKSEVATQEEDEDVQGFESNQQLKQALLQQSLAENPIDSVQTSPNLIKVMAVPGSDLNTESNIISVSNLTLYTPDEGVVICKDLSFKLKWGQSVLLFARSGAGKSSLLRAICGLWNKGRGEIQRPEDGKSIFLSQKPYMPVGNLKEQMLYPAANNVSDEQLKEILSKVHIPHILSRSGSLLATRNWSSELSLGEQQRLAFSRVICSQPLIAFLDESTSGLDKDNEKALYKLLAENTHSYVSIGHKPTLFSYHTHVLSLDDEETGQWSFSRMKDFLKKNEQFVKDYAPFQ